MKNKHVVIIANQVGFDNGSVANIAAHHLYYLHHSFKITVVTSFIDDQSLAFCHANHINVITCKSFSLYHLRRLSHFIREWLLCQSFKRQLKLLHKNDSIDFVICHSHTSAYFSVKPLQKLGVKFCVITHGNIFLRPQRTYDSLLTAMYKIATLGANNSANAVVVLSQSMIPQIRKTVTSDNVVVIPNGISDASMPSYNNHDKEVQSNNHKLLWVGSFTAVKNPQMMLHILAKLTSLEKNIHLDMVGEGPLLNECISLASKLGLENHLAFHQQLPHKNVKNLFAKRPIFCLTSLNESLPTVVLEAMIYKSPVVATDIIGVKDLIDHQVNGLLSDKNDIDAMVKNINYLLTNNRQRLAYTKSAYVTAMTEYSWPNTAKKLEDMICSLLS